MQRRAFVQNVVLNFNLFLFFTFFKYVLITPKSVFYRFNLFLFDISYQAELLGKLFIL